MNRKKTFLALAYILLSYGIFLTPFTLSSLDIPCATVASSPFFRVKS